MPKARIETTKNITREKLTRAGAVGLIGPVAISGALLFAAAPNAYAASNPNLVPNLNIQQEKLQIRADSKVAKIYAFSAAVDAAVLKERAIEAAAASRSEHARASATDYWFGESNYFDNLSASGKANAKIGYMVMHSSGYSNQEVGCIDNIDYNESKWQVHDPNPASAADGIPQANPASKMASAGADWASNPATQIKWEISYVDSRYGGPCQAWGYWQNSLNY